MKHTTEDVLRDCFSRRRFVCGRVSSRRRAVMMGTTAVRKKPRGPAVWLTALIACAGAFTSATSGFSPTEARELVALDKPHSPGSIIIDTSERRLYYVLGHGMALRYSVAVGKE